MSSAAEDKNPSMTFSVTSIVKAGCSRLLQPQRGMKGRSQ